MYSPIKSATPLDPPGTVERKRRGRNVDVMSLHPTPESKRRVVHLPTPVTEHRSVKHPRKAGSAADVGDASEVETDVEDLAAAAAHLPTPQTLPRKRLSPTFEVDEDGVPMSPPSPSGHTTFFMSQASSSSAIDKATPRRRPGLLFAQQMGLTTIPTAPTSTVKFGARLGAGVGMGGGMRSTSHGHGPTDKVAFATLDNPFLDHTQQVVGDSANAASGSSAAPVLMEPHTNQDPFRARSPGSPGTETRYVPQALRPTPTRSTSPGLRKAAQHPRRAPSTTSSWASSGPSTAPEPTPSRRRLRMMDVEDNPFVAKPGEVVERHPTSEDKPLVTYVFRGAKKVFANPFVPPSTEYLPANLDPSDPDFDSHPCPPPRLLWPSAGNNGEGSRRPDARTSTSEDRSSTPRPAPSRRLGAFQSTDMGIDAGSLTDDEDFVPLGYGNAGGESYDEGASSADETDMVPVSRRLQFTPTARSLTESLSRVAPAAPPPGRSKRGPVSPALDATPRPGKRRR